MPILAYLGSGPPPVQPVQQWFGMDVSWTDCNGITWDLNNDDVLLVQGDVRGLGMPKFDRYTQSGPALAGSAFKGWRTQEREVFWPILVHTFGSTAEWLSLDQRFWAGMRPDALGTWTITTPDGAARCLDLRFEDDGDASFSRDPMLAGWFVYGITLVAEQPYWRGETIARTWQVSGDSNWLSPSAGVFVISTGSNIDTATATNPGDVDAWPVWRVTGPAGSASLGIGGGVVEYTAAIGSGVTVEIDTRPDKMTAIRLDTGDDVSANATWSPLPVPPGVSVETALALSSAGDAARVELNLTPLYFRAW